MGQSAIRKPLQQKQALENTQVGPFLIVRRLGKSRRQQVFHARQVAQQRDVALKFISWPRQVPREQALEKVQREVLSLKKLKHKNLALTYGAGAHEEKIFFASELIQGESLAAILTRRGRLATDLVVEYGRQIAEILRYLHSVDLVHGQLTPKKLMVTPGHKIKLIDMRVCRPNRRRWDAPKRVQPEVAAYLAPEQFTTGPGQRADFYSLGVILYEMTAGQLPVEPDTLGRMIRSKQNRKAPSVGEKVMDCPVWLDTMIAQLLEPQDKNRPYSAKAIVVAFDEIKRLDTTRKGAAAQLAGNFSPLNAGRDKSEAKRVLGKKSSKHREPAEPFYQTIPFLVGALLLTAFAGIWFALPPNAGELVARGQVLVESSNPADWETAAESMKRVMESKSKHAPQAEQIFLLAKRQSLRDLAQRGMKNRAFHSPATRAFVDAYNAEQEGDSETAKAQYFNLVQSLDPNDSKAHIYLEAKKRFKNLADKITLPESKKMLLALIDQTKRARVERELVFAKRVLTKIYVEKSGEDQFEEIANKAKEALDTIQLALDSARAVTPDTNLATPPVKEKPNAVETESETNPTPAPVAEATIDDKLSPQRDIE